jgi:hypothetical protein
MPQLSTPESIIPSKRLKIYASNYLVCTKVETKTFNLTEQQCGKWILGSYNILKGSGTISARFSDILTR